MPMVMKRIQNRKEFRLQSIRAATRKFADYPTGFMEIGQPNTSYIPVEFEYAVSLYMSLLSAINFVEKKVLTS